MEEATQTSPLPAARIWYAGAGIAGAYFSKLREQITLSRLVAVTARRVDWLADFCQARGHLLDYCRRAAGVTP